MSKYKICPKSPLRHSAEAYTLIITYCICLSLSAVSLVDWLLREMHGILLMGLLVQAGKYDLALLWNLTLVYVKDKK